MRVKVWRAAEVQGDMLLGHEAGANAGTQVLVEETGYRGGRDVLAAFEETAREDGDGVRMGLDQLGEDFGEADLVFETANGAPLPGE